MDGASISSSPVWSSGELWTFTLSNQTYIYFLGIVTYQFLLTINTTMKSTASCFFSSGFSGVIKFPGLCLACHIEQWNWRSQEVLSSCTLGWLSALSVSEYLWWLDMVAGRGRKIGSSRPNCGLYETLSQATITKKERKRKREKRKRKPNQDTEHFCWT